MRRFLRAGLTLALAAGAAGCVDLSEKLVSSLGSNYATTQQGLTDLTNGIYAGVRGYDQGDSYYGMEQMGVDTWMAADQVTSGGAQNWVYLDTYASTYNTLAAFINVQWQTGYQIIARANVVLDNAPNTPVGGALTQAIKDSRMGEAYFLRAYTYFQLVQQYGDLTINLHQPVGTLTTEATRESQDSVYKVIIADLTQAVNLLPATQGDWGRVPKGAAQALLSKVYLTRAYTSFKQSDDFQKAYDLANTVITSGTYSLVPVYADLWCGQHRGAVPADPGRQGFCELGNQFSEKNSEILWSVQFSYDPVQYTNTASNYYHVVFLSQYDGGAGGWASGITRDVDNGRPFRRIRPTPYTYYLYNQTRYANGLGAIGADVLDTRFDGSYQTVWFANSNASNASTGCPKCTSGAPIKGTMILNNNVNQGAAIGSDTALVYLGFDVPDSYRQSKAYRIGTPCSTTYTNPKADCGSELTPGLKDQDALGRYGHAHYPSLKKFQDNLRPGTASEGPVADQRGGKDIIKIRLGEVYLLKAEAALGLGQTQAAADAINVLRVRAACDPSTSVKLCATSHKTDPLLMVSAGQVNLDLIYDERERELGGELMRWDDMHRPGKAFFLKRISDFNPNAKAIADKHYYRPIPAQQIQGVTGTPYPQNPGW